MKAKSLENFIFPIEYKRILIWGAILDWEPGKPTNGWNYIILYSRVRTEINDEIAYTASNHQVLKALGIINKTNDDCIITDLTAVNHFDYMLLQYFIWN